MEINFERKMSSFNRYICNNHNDFNLTHLQSRHPTQLFKVELSLLVGGNHKIPSICERLMSTIERTGLYVEGIYRKSGAAPKLRDLTAALEAGWS